MNILPPMTVEQRESLTAHGIPEPDLSPANLSQQIEEAIILNEKAKTGGWGDDTIEILMRYVSGDADDIIDACSEVLGMDSWQEVVEFVQDDECTEFFNLVLSYCKKEGQVHRKEKGFIDGSGIGYMNAYLRELKPRLEECFDAKWFYQVKRPLEYIADVYGMESIHKVANHIHPGHWAYPAGHGTKFLAAYFVAKDVFHLDRRCDFMIKVAAEVASMGRSGSLIHYPQDNLAAYALWE